MSILRVDAEERKIGPSCKCIGDGAEDDDEAARQLPAAPTSPLRGGTGQSTRNLINRPEPRKEV